MSPKTDTGRPRREDCCSGKGESSEMSAQTNTEKFKRATLRGSKKKSKITLSSTKSVNKKSMRARPIRGRSSPKRATDLMNKGLPRLVTAGAVIVKPKRTPLKVVSKAPRCCMLRDNRSTSRQAASRVDNGGSVQVELWIDEETSEVERSRVNAKRSAWELPGADVVRSERKKWCKKREESRSKLQQAGGEEST